MIHHSKNHLRPGMKPTLWFFGPRSIPWFTGTWLRCDGACFAYYRVPYLRHPGWTLT